MEKYSLLNSRAGTSRGLKTLSRAAALAAMIMAPLISGGCLVGNDDFDKARLARDEYRDELVRLHESNDILKREVLEIYESCDLISKQLTVMAAMSIHDRYTANLGRPVLPPPIPAATTTTPSRPARATQREVRREQGGQPQGAAGRPGSGSGRAGSSGGTPNSPPPAPPVNSGGGGSIDWGL